MTTLYHSTSIKAAAQISKGGFLDADFLGVARGVCFSDRPLDPGDGVALTATACFAVAVPPAVDLAAFEIIEDGRPDEAYREWLIPAQLVNAWKRRRYFDGLHFGEATQPAAAK